MKSLVAITAETVRSPNSNRAAFSGVKRLIGRIPAVLILSAISLRASASREAPVVQHCSGISANQEGRWIGRTRDKPRLSGKQSIA